MSHGCIRLYPEDIAQLYEVVPVGTPVQVISQAIKIGWYDGELYVEAHPESGQADELESTGEIKSVDAHSRVDALYRITTLAGAARDRLDWQVIRRAFDERSGIPVQVTVDRTEPSA